MARNWAEEQHYNYGEGIYRVTQSTDPEYPQGALPEALNCVYEQDSDNPTTMKGASQLGSTAMGGAVSGLFDYNKGDKLVAACEDGKFYEYGADWAVVANGARKTGNSTTAGKRWAGAMFNGKTTGKNLLVLANDDDSDTPVRYDTTNGAVTLGGSPPSQGKYPVPWQGRMWMFDDSTAFYSAPDDCEDWTSGNGGGSIAIYPGYDGNITGAAAFANDLFIFKKSSIYRIPAALVPTDYNVLNVNMAVGCVSHHSIRNVFGAAGDYLVWWSEHGLEAISSSQVAATVKPVNVSRWVQSLLDAKNLDQMTRAWGLYNMRRLEYWTFYPAGSNANPSLGVCGNFARPRKPPRWTRCDQANLTAGVMYNNIQYVGTTGGKVLKMHDDEVSTWDGADFTKKAQTRYRMGGAPHRMKRYGYSYVNVSATQPSAVTVRQAILRPKLNVASAGTNSTALSTAVGDDGWGVGAWGVALWGGSGTAGERIRPPVTARGLGLSHVLETTKDFTLRGDVVASRMLSDKEY